MPTAMPALALNLNRTYRTMPAPPTAEPPQTGLLVAVTAAITAMLTAAGNWTVGKLQRKTTLEVKAVESRDGYTDDLREDVKQLRQEFREAQTAMDTLRRESESERKAAQLQMDLLRNEGIEKNKRIAHLEMEIERLTYQLTQMQDDGRVRQQEHEETVTRLQNDLVAKNTLIVQLRQQIADMEVIGVGEKPPPKRQKEIPSP